MASERSSVRLAVRRAVGQSAAARAWALAGALACLFPALSRAGGGTTLPVPCVAGNCGPNGPQTWVTSGSARAVQSGNTLTVTQQSENAILNWQSFNIDSNGTVTFKQPDAAAVALNQIFQASPSKILGALNANGSIYLINQNGIVFGAGAQVNTGSLIASSLNITPAALNGILNAALNGSPAFASFVDANGNPLHSGPVQVAAGATLNAGSGGQIMLFGPEVTNQGSISTNGGQVILAAGDSVYLAVSTDPNLRGLLVEVGHGGTVTNAAATGAGGTVAGQISAGDGNVTLVGLIVNQLGRISATTAVQQNGSIYLLAQDGGSAITPLGSTVATLTASEAGTLTLGAGSHTDVTPDLASTATAVDATAQPKSQVVLSGQAVTLAGTGGE
jgi:filamentous hemagglutinin family protein